MTDQANPTAIGKTGSRAERTWDDFEELNTELLFYPVESRGDRREPIGRFLG